MAGRALRAPRCEMLADRKLGVRLGESVALGDDRYTVVGITGGAVDASGNPLVYLSLPDAQKVQFDQDKRAQVAARAASLRRLEALGVRGEAAERLLPAPRRRRHGERGAGAPRARRRRRGGGARTSATGST